MSSDTWSYQQLGEVFPKIVVGYVGNVNKYYCDKNEGVPFYRTLNIRDGYFNNHDKKYVTREFNDRNKKSQIENGDILIARVGANLGMICQVSGISGPANIANAIVIKSRYIKSGDPKFFAYFLVSPIGKNQIYSRAAGGAQGVFNTKLTQSLIVPNPPIAEQKKIAQILSTWDKAITTSEQLLANSQQQKKALMQQLLTGKKRLLDDNGVRFSGEWRSTAIRNLFARVTTKNQGQSENVVTISGQLGLINQREFFSKSVASKTLDNYTLLRKGQFAYNKSYSNGYPMGAIKRLNRYEMAVVTTLYICFEIQAEEKADSDFWEQYFEAGLLNQGLSQVAHEGGRAHGLLNVKPSDFFGLKVPLPSINEQTAIGKVLAHADKDIRALSTRVELLKSEKKALMQQLLTGKRRVKVDEEAA